MQNVGRLSPSLISNTNGINFYSSGRFAIQCLDLTCYTLRYIPADAVLEIVSQMVFFICFYAIRDENKLGKCSITIVFPGTDEPLCQFKGWQIVSAGTCSCVLDFFYNSIVIGRLLNEVVDTVCIPSHTGRIVCIIGTLIIRKSPVSECGHVFWIVQLFHLGLYLFNQVYQNLFGRRHSVCTAISVKWSTGMISPMFLSAYITGIEPTR